MSGRAAGSRDCYELRRETQGQRGPAGRRLCTWCRQEVPRGRRFWCSDACVESYKIQANPQGFRDAVWKRDRGACAICGLDTFWLHGLLADLIGSPSIACLLLAMCGWRMVRYWRFGAALWEADHIVPVVESGADSLENARTLCRPCHLDVTAELCRRRALRRRAQRPLPLEAAS